MLAEVQSAKLPLSRVVLYKHGLGFFERRGPVSGPVNIELTCGAGEIDDMLKSLVVLSVGGGRVSEITYQCSRSLETRLSEFGFDIKSCQGLVDLLAQLKGVPVTVAMAGASVSGRVIGADEVEQIVGQVKVREQQLVLYTDDCLFKRFSLSSLEAIRIEEPKIAAEIREQLKLLYEGATRRGAKRLTVHFEEDQEREAIIAYSTPCPIWKTSYRLVFLADGRLLTQGLAIVDNVQDEDWNDVQMTLVSAAPISFVQPLYDPIQPLRQKIAAQGVRSAGPVTAGRGQEAAAFAELPAGALNRLGQQLPGVRAWAARQELSLAPSLTPAAMGGAMLEELEISELPVSAEAVGELFEYRIGRPVTIKSNSSALVPILNEVIEGERVSLYNASLNPDHPYATVRLINTTGLTLEAGPVTVLEDDSYAGEGLLDVLKPGDTRFLPYALDQGVHVIVRKDHQRRPMWRLRIADGFLYMDYREKYEQAYHLENLTDRLKLLYIEHPVLPEMKLIGPEKPAEATQSHYRFRVELAPRQSKRFPVLEESESVQHIRIDNVEALAVTQLEALVAQNVLDRKFSDFLKLLLQRRHDICDLREMKRQAEEQLAQFSADQQRARENIKTLGTASDRYRKAIDAAEDRIVETSSLLKQIDENIARLEREYANLVATEMIQELEPQVTESA